MTFAEATDQLMARGVTLQEMGAALGVAHTTIRAFRLDPASDSYRRPPEDWAPKLARLARGRGAELQAVAAELEGDVGQPETRTLVIAGEIITFQVELHQAVGTGGILPPPDTWMLTATTESRKTRLEVLGTGQFPAQSLAQYTDQQLEQLWQEFPRGR